MSVWDESSLQWSKDCGSCPYRKEAFCYWGVAIKILFQRSEELRHCGHRYYDPPRDSASRINPLPALIGKGQRSTGESTQLKLI